MTLHQLYDRLCYYDSRNPYGSTDEDEEAPAWCQCDNCFYGRAGLSLFIIDLLELLGLMDTIGEHDDILEALKTNKQE